MKKALALMLALVMMFALVACGSTKEAPAETPAETPAEAPAASGSIFDDPDAPTFELKVGHVQADTHPYHMGLTYLGDLLA